MVNGNGREGLYLRGKVWSIDFQFRGQRHLHRLGKIDKEAAIACIDAYRTDLARGELRLNPGIRKDIAFDAMATEFLEWARVNRRAATHSTYAKVIRLLQRAFSGRRLSEITTRHIEHYKQERAGWRRKPETINQELRVLKILINHAIRTGRFEGENPVPESALFKVPKSFRDRFLTHDEEDALLAQLPAHFRPVVLVGIHAGLRIPSEALALRWEDVNFERRTLKVRGETSKNGHDRVIGLNPVLVDALDALPHDTSRVFTFPSGLPINRIQKPVQVAARALGYEGVSPHIFRHTFFTRLAMAGTPLMTLMELGGWSSFAMVKRYSHFSDEHRRQAVERSMRPGTPPSAGVHKQAPKRAKVRDIRSKRG